MNLVQKVELWGDTHHTRWAEALRIGLGLIIFTKGISFISDNDALDDMIRNSRFEFIAFILSHYVATMHLVGGLLITLGLLTRWAIAFQLPILAGAILFINQIGSFSAINSEFTLSAVVFLLLCFFFVYGSGQWSLDEYMKTHKES